jgi:hypothetical protein
MSRMRFKVLSVTTFLTVVTAILGVPQSHADPCVGSAPSILDVSPFKPSEVCNLPLQAAPRDPDDGTPQSDQVKKDFQQSKDLILDRLPAAGITQVSGEPLPQLKTEMSKAALTTEPWLCVKDQDSGLPSFRSSAQWWRKTDGTNGIKVNDRVWPSTPASVKPVMSLHEYLSSAGIDDHDYSCSTSLWLLSHPNAYQGILNSDEVNDLKNYSGNQLCKNRSPSTVQFMNGGSSTGVGGGGDGRAIEQKMLSIIKHLADMQEIEREVSANPSLSNQEPQARKATMQQLHMALDGTVVFMYEAFGGDSTAPAPAEPDLLCNPLALAGAFCESTPTNR